VLVLAAALFAWQASLLAQGKAIHLRNETIDPAAPANHAVMAASAKNNASATNLFLIQFSQPLTPGQRQELRAAGVDLLKYVPEDAFIAKLDHVSPASIAARQLVTWVGPYRPEHKIHPRLAATIQGLPHSNQTVAVSILVSAAASPAEIAAVRSLLASVQSESHLRQGVFLRGNLAPQQLDALAQSSVVLWVEGAPKHKLVDEAAAKLVGGDDGRVATPTVTEQLGFNGTNVTVCVADTGLDSGNTNTLHPDLRGRVTGFQYFPPLTDGSDGYGHGTHCAGIVAGDAATGETDPDSKQFYGQLHQ
jgi:hypothetical protein